MIIMIIIIIIKIIIIIIIIGMQSPPYSTIPRPRPKGLPTICVEYQEGEMDKTSISMFEILEPGGQLWANTAFEGF